MDNAADTSTSADRLSTRHAVRWVAGCVAAVIAVYGLVSVWVTDDSYLTRMGRVKEVHFILRDVREVDREATYGDAPVTWIIGSSIARETFDAERIEARLAEAGSEHRVAKFAFNRGAPIFTQAIADDLPLRPGDRVVTSIAEGNFRLSWLEEAAAFDEYVQAILGPHEIFSLSDASFANQLEWSLGSTPPSAFFRNQPAFRRGLVEVVGSWFGLWKVKSRRHVSYQPFTKTKRTLRKNADQDWTLPPDELQLGPGQTNYDGLTWLIEDLEARGVDLTVVYVPGHPRLYEAFVKLESVEAVQEHFDGREELDYHRLAPRKGKAYQDYKHPNDRGRPGFSDDLADLLLTAQGLPLPPREADSMRAPQGLLPEPLHKALTP
ncbi:MAG: hypothetical protein AB8H79_19735 [Myxococcota bacterium]